MSSEQNGERIARLESKVADLREDISGLRQDVAAVLEHVSATKGAWRMLTVLGVATVSLGGLIATIVGFFRH